MATPKGKNDKPLKISAEDDDDAPVVKPAVEEETTPETPDPAPVVEANIEKAKPSVSDLVTVAMYVEVDPAPTIGHPAHGGYNFRDHGVMKLEARKNYIVPRRVAEVLIDKKLASIVG